MRRVALLLMLSLAVTPLQAAESVDVAGLDNRVKVLERKVKAISDLVLRMDRLQREVQQLRGELEEQAHAMEGMKQRQRELYLDVDRRLGQVTSQDVSQTPAPAAPTVLPSVAGETKPGAPAKPATGPGAISKPIPALAVSPQEEKAYQQAFELLSQRRYKEAQQRFREFLKKYPDGFYVDNAQYWLAEASYVTRDFDTALTEFSTVLKQYPDSPKVPGAMLKIGYIQYEKQRLGEARQTLETLIERFPGSSAARLATSFIRKKGL